MRRIGLILLMAGALPVQAQEGAAPLPPALPERMADRLRDAPDKFLDAAAGVIFGHGSGGGIDRAGIDRYIAVERAAARAGELRRFLAADLDNDGTVTAEEVGVVAAVASARQRGRLHMAFQRADADGNGRLTPAELRAQAEVAAMKAMPTAAAAQWQALLLLDGDADGWVTLAEVSAVVATLRDSGTAESPRPPGGEEARL